MIGILFRGSNGSHNDCPLPLRFPISHSDGHAVIAERDAGLFIDFLCDRILYDMERAAAAPIQRKGRVDESEILTWGLRKMRRFRRHPYATSSMNGFSYPPRVARLLCSFSTGGIGDPIATGSWSAMPGNTISSRKRRRKYMASAWIPPNEIER